MREEMKKKFAMFQKKIETNLKNQQNMAKMKEPPNKKLKDSNKNNKKEEKENKQNKIPNKNTNLLMPIKPEQNKNNLNQSKNINNNHNINLDTLIKNKEIINERKSINTKIPKNNININNNNDNDNNILRISTPAAFINKKSDSINNKVSNNTEQKKIEDKNDNTKNDNTKNDNKKELMGMKNKTNDKKLNDKVIEKEKNRTKSLINNKIPINIIKNIFQEEITKKEIKKSRSLNNEIKKIDINKLISKKEKTEKNINSNDLDEIMKIDDVVKIDEISKERKTTGNKSSITHGLKRTITSNTKSQKDPLGMKKRHSLLDDNNMLTIKLKSKNNYTKDDFEVVTFSGKGAYGTVLQVYLIKDPKKKIYAIKKLDINSLYSVNRLYQAYLENDILNELDSPYIVKVYGAFEADGKIQLVMDYLPKADFDYFIKNNFPLKDDIIRFYSAEIVLFLEYMQKMKLIHRDLKPQNIMIDEKGHLKVIDFGTVRKLDYYYDKREMKFKEEKIFERIDSEDIKGVKNIVNPDEEDADEDDFEDEEDEEDEENENNLSEKKKRRIQKVRTKRSMTFVGTAEYISPEVIADKPAEFGTDVWAFGVMLYQMYLNTTPFKAITTYLTFRNIEKPNVTFPKDSNIPDVAKDLILKILVVEPKNRLGGGEAGSNYDIAHLKKHPFFKKIKWNNLHNSSVPGLKELKFYECKKKSIYKDQEVGNGRYSDGYKVFDDKSKEKNNDAKIIQQGIIKKKSTWFHYEKRNIILDTTPRIILKAVNEENYYREIPLNKKCKITLVENNCFDLKTPEKTHRFKGVSNDGNEWAGYIVDAITAYAKE